MNNQPTAIEYLASEITRLLLEKAYLQEALAEANAKIAALEAQIKKLKGDKK